MPIGKANTLRVGNKKVQATPEERYNSSLEGLESQLDSIPTKSGGNLFWKPRENDQVNIRPLPNLDTSRPMGRTIGFHWWENQPYLCPNYVEDTPFDCPICELLSMDNTTVTDKVREKLGLSIRFVFNLAIQDSEGEWQPKLWEAPPTILKHLVTLAKSGVGDYTDPDTGFVLRLVRDDSGAFTQYTLIPLANKVVPIGGEILKNTKDVYGEYASKMTVNEDALQQLAVDILSGKESL